MLPYPPIISSIKDEKPPGHNSDFEFSNPDFNVAHNERPPNMDDSPMNIPTSMNHPSMNHPSMNHPSINHPSMHHPSMNHPSMNHPPMHHPSMNYPHLQTNGQFPVHSLKKREINETLPIRGDNNYELHYEHAQQRRRRRRR